MFVFKVVLSLRLMSQPGTHQVFNEQCLSAAIEFQVPVFKNSVSPGYTCCVAKPFLSLVAGDTVQEVQEAVEECVADFIKLYIENGHQVPAAPEAPSRQSLSNQDGFEQLLTVRVPGM